jgi:hypothetical protein
VPPSLNDQQQQKDNRPFTFDRTSRALPQDIRRSHWAIATKPEQENRHILEGRVFILSPVRAHLRTRPSRRPPQSRRRRIPAAAQQDVPQKTDFVAASAHSRIRRGCAAGRVVCKSRVGSKRVNATRHAQPAAYSHGEDIRDGTCSRKEVQGSETTSHTCILVHSKDVTISRSLTAHGTLQIIYFYFLIRHLETSNINSSFKVSTAQCKHSDHRQYTLVRHRCCPMARPAISSQLKAFVVIHFRGKSPST